MENIVTGVIQTNNAEYLYEDALEGICVTCLSENCTHTEGDCDSCGIDEMDYLIGFRFDPKSGKYEPDPEAEYSAIINGSSYTTQIVKSKWIAQCRQCSPCYPGQGDLDTPGEDYWAYCVPPELFGEFDDFDTSRIKEVKDATIESE